MLLQIIIKTLVLKSFIKQKLRARRLPTKKSTLAPNAAGITIKASTLAPNAAGITLLCCERHSATLAPNAAGIMLS